MDSLQFRHERGSQMAILKKDPFALCSCLFDAFFGDLRLSLSQRQDHEVIFHLILVSQNYDFIPGVSPRGQNEKQRNVLVGLLKQEVKVKWRRVDKVLSQFLPHQFSNVLREHLRTNNPMQNHFVVVVDKFIHWQHYVQSIAAVDELLKHLRLSEQKLVEILEFLQFLTQFYQRHPSLISQPGKRLWQQRGRCCSPHSQEPDFVNRDSFGVNHELLHHLERKEQFVFFQKRPAN